MRFRWMRAEQQTFRNKALHVAGIAVATCAGLTLYGVASRFGDQARAALLLSPAAAYAGSALSSFAADRLRSPAPVMRDCGLSVLVVASLAYFGLLVGLADLSAVVLLCAGSVGASLALSWRAAKHSSEQAEVTLRLALHDAIVSDRDIVPATAKPFYDPALARQSEEMVRNMGELASFAKENPKLWPASAAETRSINVARGLHRKHFD